MFLSTKSSSDPILIDCSMLDILRNIFDQFRFYLQSHQVASSAPQSPNTGPAKRSRQLALEKSNNKQMIAKFIGPFKQKELYLNHAVLLVDYLLQMLKSHQQVVLSFIL